MQCSLVSRYEACQGSALFVLLLLQHHADRQMKRFVGHAGFWFHQIIATSAVHVAQMSGPDHDASYCEDMAGDRATMWSFTAMM